MRTFTLVFVAILCSFISTVSFADGLDVASGYGAITLGLAGLIGGLISYSQRHTLIAFLQGFAIGAGGLFLAVIAVLLIGLLLESKSKDTSHSPNPAVKVDGLIS